MKKFILTTLALVASISLLSAQEKEKEVKTGWSMGVLPCATYSVDNGLQYGAFGDVYYYGDGTTYPDPVHKISWEASHFTKGKTRLYLGYDSKYLIPNMRVNASVTYVDDPMYNFWGFNGTQALQNYDLWTNKGITEGKPDNFNRSINYYGLSRPLHQLLWPEPQDVPRAGQCPGPHHRQPQLGRRRQLLELEDGGHAREPEEPGYGQGPV